MILLDAVRELRLAARWDTAHALISHALTTLDDPVDQARFALAAAEIEMDRAFLGKDPSGVDEAIARARSAVEKTSDATMAYALDLIELNVAYGRLFRTDAAPEVIGTLTDRAAHLCATAPDPGLRGQATFYRALITDLLAGDHELGATLYAETLALAEASGDELLASYALRHQAFPALMAGEVERAEDLATRSLEIRQRAGFVPGVLAQWILFAEIAQAKGEVDRARVLKSAAVEWCRALEVHRLVDAAADVLG